MSDDPERDFWDRHDYSPRGDPDGAMAGRYHEMYGEWPKGSRQRWERDRDEAEARRKPFDRRGHPGMPQRSPREQAEADVFITLDTDVGTVRLSLDPKRIGGRQIVDGFMWRSLRIEERQEWIRHTIIPDMIFNLKAYVLAERLPPAVIDDEQAVENVSVHVGPATWRDFWKLTHGHRWWAHWWVRQHPARIIDHPQTVRWMARAKLDLNRWRAYPYAPDIAVRDKLGPSTVHIVFPDRESVFWSWRAR